MYYRLDLAFINLHYECKNASNIRPRVELHFVELIDLCLHEAHAGYKSPEIVSNCIDSIVALKSYSRFPEMVGPLYIYLDYNFS